MGGAWMTGTLVGEFTKGTTLVVQNLSQGVTMELLRQFFEFLGPIERLKLFSSPTLGSENKRFCLVEFKEESHVLPALHLDGTEMKMGVLSLRSLPETLRAPSRKWTASFSLPISLPLSFPLPLA